MMVTMKSHCAQPKVCYHAAHVDKAMLENRSRESEQV